MQLVRYVEGFRTCSCSAGNRTIDGIIEHFVISDAAGCGSNGVFLRKPAIEKEGDPAFGNRAVASQAPAFEVRQVMVCLRSANAGQMVTDDDDVAFPIRGG